MRTLRNWKRHDPATPMRSPGRPRVPESEWGPLTGRVLAEVERQGWAAGEGPIHRALGGVPLWRVRKVLAELKAERKARMRREAEARRVHTRVEAKDAIWAMDATHLGRDPAGAAVEAMVVRELCSTRTLGLSIGPVATAEEVVGLLERLVAERGRAPLVLQVDNGPQFRAWTTSRWAVRHGVELLFNLPRTPQHNAACEHGHGELKGDAALGKGVLVHDIGDACARLVRARERIDGARLRRTRGWRTAVEVDGEATPWDALVDREVFREKAACAIREAVLDSNTWRERRLAIREAILATLQELALITRTRGGRSGRAHNAEDVL